MAEILEITNKLYPETRYKLLQVLAETREERNNHAESLPNHQKGSMAHILRYEKDFGLGAANIFLETGHLNAAKELFERYDDYYKASIVAKKQGNTEEARTYARKLVEEIRYLHPDFLIHTSELFSAKELEDVLAPMIDRFKEQGDLIINVVLAKKQEDNEKINQLYEESKARIKKARDTEYDKDDMEALENITYITHSLENTHSILCEIIGKYEEVINLREFENSGLLLKDCYSDLVDKRENRDVIYENMVDDAIMNTHPPNYLAGAKAAEKLGWKESADEYYILALEQCESRLWLGTAFEIAKKIKADQKLNAYVLISNFLYENKYI